MVQRNGKPPICRICNADPQYQHLRSRTVFGGEQKHAFWQCDECDAVYLFPVPSIAEEAHFYHQEFEKYMAERSGKMDWTTPNSHVHANKHNVERRWPFLSPHLYARQNLLEIGCSSGFMMDEFVKHGLNCVGIEPSGVFSEFLLSKGYEVYAGLDAFREKSEKKFDLIVHFFVLEHIRDPYFFFKESMDLLNAGGKIIAEIPCVNDPLTRVV